MCSALLYVFRKFCARCFRFRSRVFLACHVFSFLLSSLSFFRSRVLVLCHMFPFACGHVFYFTYGVFFRPAPLIFFTHHYFILHFVSCPLSHVCFALVSSSLFVIHHLHLNLHVHTHRTFSYYFICSHFHFTLRF